ncbi:autotransporter outer membrane beta-barrel domain-containing protein [Polynucleobacter sp.]|uniref:beta strand repeat-containing protein n=1 Tax=Polynucleobacter sp. TaxID=2029855 RepID=UPI0025F46981|nr:autotransporter outer membrane beta-barrel domain-containing protein [Polynucleobacter sp.]
MSSTFSLSNNQCVQVASTGSITVAAGGVGIYGGWVAGLGVSNAGTITAGIYGYGVGSDGGTFSYITNSGTITIVPSSSSNSSGIRLQNNASAYNVINSGQIQGGDFGISLTSVDSITNLTNTGSIYASDSGYNIFNQGAITTFNNAQGGNASSATTTSLTYNGNLPTYYNIIVRSPTYHGQLAVTSPSGATTFGIYSGGVDGVAASTLTKGTYSSVLSGITSANLTGATSGNYNGFTWRLNNSAGTIWDLIVTGASTADTQASLQNTASSLQNTYALQNSVLANSFSYDCTVFGANNVCISAAGRNTAVSAANGLNNTSALLIAGYRLNNNYRIGAYADQNLSVNNAGSTVNLGNNTPLIGVFSAWNERQDGTGTEVKVSAAYGQKNTTITRSVVGTSEAGSGSSQLNSQGAQVVAKYGFGFVDQVVVSPYAGVRYTQNTMGGYTEGASSAVTAPLTYSALNTNATTALAGVGASYRGIPQTTLFASAGVESDTNTSNGTYSATGVTGLTPVNFNANPVKTRPTATLGASYDVAKNQRLGITGIYRQEPYQAVQTTTVMATYTVGL